MLALSIVYGQRAHCSKISLVGRGRISISLNRPAKASIDHKTHFEAYTADVHRVSAGDDESPKLSPLISIGAQNF